MGLADEPLLGALGTNTYWARHWLLFGREVQPIIGSVRIFERGSGGYVGFAIGQDDGNFYVLGGNQSDAVTIARIAKSRLLGARWPATYPPYLQRLPCQLASPDKPLTRSEVRKRNLPGLFAWRVRGLRLPVAAALRALAPFGAASAV